jgi:hypothetical protein
MKIDVLSRDDWDFDNVPDHEIIACCLWEYARESITIGMAADKYWCNVRDIVNRQRYKLEPETKAAHDEEAARIQRRLKASGFDYEEFSNKFWDSDLAAVEFYRSIKEHVINGARAWQQIPLEPRVQLSKQVSESHILHPLAPAMVGELEKLWNTNSGNLDEIRSKPRPEYDDSEECALYQSSEPVTLEVESGKPSGGSMAVAFAVDFTHFSDREILAELQQWLAAHRPKHWQRPRRVFPGSKQKGRKLIEYRVAVERLGIMRLLHWYTPTELQRDMPEAWARYGRKKADFRREVREARKFFRRLFPFLPKTELPQSEPRKGVWFPEIVKICEQVEHKMGMSGGA